VEAVIKEILTRLVANWATPQSATHRGEATEFALRCQVEQGPATGNPGVDVPEPLQEFWTVASGARLFEDSDYGQWGLVLLSPDAAAQRTNELLSERENQWRPGDLVLGEFLGDQDLLLIRCDPAASDFGHVVIVLPLDDREDWDDVASSLHVFLAEYERAEGAKYWEKS